MPAAAPNVTITVDPNQTTPISPWIYGLNFYTGVTGAPPRLNLDRAGGNRWTAYNWETNASNAGSDYLYENDDYLSPALLQPKRFAASLRQTRPLAWPV